MSVSAQFPLPSFEDIRKILEFWFEQEHKWFYFETNAIESSSVSSTQTSNTVLMSSTYEDKWYAQTRIAGKIFDVVTYPPSLYLENASVITVELRFRSPDKRILTRDVRTKYGLVFSQITYYEPIDDIETFLRSDPRVTG